MIRKTRSGKLSIRPTREDDLEALSAALEPGIGAVQIRHRLEESLHGHREMLVAELEGQAVGTVSMGGRSFQRPGSLRLFALDVGTAFRRQGIDTALVEAAVAAGRALGEVNLEVAVDNEDAIRLYERLGFRRHGDPVVDCWQQWRDDGSSQLIEVPSWVMIKTWSDMMLREPVSCDSLSVWRALKECSSIAAS